MKYAIYSFLIVLTILLSSCSKEKSKRWFVADLTLKSSVGAPLNRVVELEYTEDLFLSNPGRKMNLGYTDANGKMYIEEKIHPKAKRLKLKIYYNYNVTGEDVLVEDLSKTKKNVIVVDL